MEVSGENIVSRDKDLSTDSSQNTENKKEFQLPIPKSLTNSYYKRTRGNYFLSNFLSKHFHKWKQKFDLDFFHRLPFFIVTISFIQVCAYYLVCEHIKVFLIYDTEKKSEAWRFLTYMFLHTDFIHLWLNIFIQIFLGIPLEMEQGHWRCGTIYFSGGIAGSLGVSTFDTLSQMAGASGGIYALLISQIPNIVLNYDSMKYAAYRTTAVLALTTSDILYVSYHNYVNNNESPRIGWAAHFSGALSGLLLGFIIFKGTSKCKKEFQAVSSVFLLGISALFVTYNLLAMF